MAKGSQIISIDDQGGGTSGETGTIGTVEGNKISFSAADCGLDKAADVTTLVLTDGTKLVFEGGGNTSTPKYYSAGGGTIRVYPKNLFTVTSSKNIKSIVITCDSYSGTDYTAEGKVTVDPGTVALDGTTLTFSGINAKSVVITNANTTTGPKSQIRIKSVVITYAE